jgi:hypothetical protein
MQKLGANCNRRNVGKLVSSAIGAMQLCTAREKNERRSITLKIALFTNLFDTIDESHIYTAHGLNQPN